MPRNDTPTTSHERRLARRTMVRGAAWAAPATVAALAAPAFASSEVPGGPTGPGPTPPPGDGPAPDCSITWWEKSVLTPGASDVTRDKEVDVNESGQNIGDVAIDGWTTPSGQPAFRVVVGSLEDIENVTVTISVESQNMTLPEQIPSGSSPAGGATPPEFKQVTMESVPAVERSSDTQYTWRFDRIAAGSSAGFSFVGVPTAGAASDIALRIELNGTYATC